VIDGQRELAARMLALEADLATVRGERDALRAELTPCRRERDRLALRLLDSEAVLAERARRAADAEHRADTLARELDAIRRTLSWRVTRPLRAIRRTLSRG
jgi:hypothetical protein